MTSEYNTLVANAVDAPPPETPTIIHNYLRKGAKKELRLSKSKEDKLFEHFVSLSGVFGYRDTLRYLCRAFLIREVANIYPTSRGWRAYTPYMEWSTRQLNLTGYAELFNAKPWSVYDLKWIIDRTATEPSDIDIEEYGTPENPGSMWWMMPESALQNLLMEIERAAWPWLSGEPNSFNWSRTDFEHHMDATARFIRGHLGLPKELPAFEPDPVVIIPKGFTGFTINGQPAPPSAVPYTPPVPTVYLTADQATTYQPDTSPAPAPQEPTLIPNDADITPYWEAVENHLGDQANEVLNPPATEADIQELETNLGLTLPQQLRESLTRHDGMATYPHDDFPGEILLSCQEIHDNHDTWNEVFEDLDDYPQDYNLTGNTGLTLPGPWNPGWIPITDDGTGNALIIDTTPGPNGTTGQIINIATDGETTGLAYPNLATLLNTYTQNNNYVHGE